MTKELSLHMKIFKFLIQRKYVILLLFHSQFNAHNAKICFALKCYRLSAI